MTGFDLNYYIFQVKNEILERNLLNLNLSPLSSEARKYLQELVFSVLKTEREMDDKYRSIMGGDFGSSDIIKKSYPEDFRAENEGK